MSHHVVDSSAILDADALFFMLILMAVMVQVMMLMVMMMFGPYYTFLVVPVLCFVIDKGCCRLGVNIWKFETHELAALL